MIGYLPTSELSDLLEKRESQEKTGTPDVKPITSKKEVWAVLQRNSWDRVFLWLLDDEFDISFIEGKVNAD